MELANVQVLRSGADQAELKKRVEGAKEIVVLGGGFIGSESAAAIKAKYKEEKNVHLIYMES
jgi:NADPH-dependent 2,4-dienoyl-CoA reductase/sulfur reductase-like enzyme